MKQRRKMHNPIIQIDGPDDEIFLPITNAYNGKIKQGYYISNKGRVFSQSHLVKKNNYIHKLALDGDYYYIKLPCIDNKTSSCRINKLVLQTFKPLDDYTNLQVFHIDGNRKNNSLENLCYKNRSDSTKNIIDNGKIRKLSDNDIISIYHLAKSGHSDESLSNKYNVSTYTIAAIRLKQNYIYQKILKDFDPIYK